MTSTVRSRPNHYETLGLKPTATDAEITQAFAREISPLRPRPFGGIAQVSIAYETLRDPAKRRAYDESIGLAKPQPAAPAAVMAQPGYAGLFGAAAAADRKADYLFSPARPAAQPEGRREPLPEKAPAPTEPPAPRQTDRPRSQEPSPAPQQAEPQPRQQQAVKPELEPWVDDFLATLRAAADRSAASAEPATGWKRPGVVVGGLFAAVGLVGALAGWWAASDIAAEPAESAADAEPAKREPAPAAAAPAPTPPPPVEEVAASEEPARTAVAPAPRIRSAQAAPAGPAMEEQRAEVEQLADDAVRADELEEIAVERVGGEATSAPAVAAKLPLPDRVVARTIHRIGYACGEVASVSAVDGGAGVFKVTCTSGDAYRAAPLRGRYHFRRWERR